MYGPLTWPIVRQDDRRADSILDRPREGPGHVIAHLYLQGQGGTAQILQQQHSMHVDMVKTGPVGWIEYETRELIKSSRSLP